MSAADVAIAAAAARADGEAEEVARLLVAVGSRRVPEHEGAGDLQSAFGCSADPGLPTVDDLQIAAAAAAGDELQHRSLDGPSGVRKGKSTRKSLSSSTDLSDASTDDASDATSCISSSSSDVSQRIGTAGVGAPRQTNAPHSLRFERSCRAARVQDMGATSAKGCQSSALACTCPDGSEREVAELISCIIHRVTVDAEDMEPQFAHAFAGNVSQWRGIAGIKLENGGMQDTMVDNDDIMEVLNDMLTFLCDETTEMHNGGKASNLSKQFSQHEEKEAKPTQQPGSGEASMATGSFCAPEETVEVTSDSSDSDTSTSDSGPGPFQPDATLDMLDLGEDNHEDKICIGLDLPPKSPVQVRIKESDWLQPAGIISSIVEDMLVIQAHKTSKPLDVGSLLCLSNRVPLGRVDDIFGPVDGPLYLVRFCGEGGLHENVKENDAAFSVAKYSTYLEAGPRNCVKVKEEAEEDWYIAGESEGEVEEHDLECGRERTANKDLGVPAAKRQKFENLEFSKGRGVASRSSQKDSRRGAPKRKGKELQQQQLRWRQTESDPLPGRKSLPCSVPDRVQLPTATNPVHRAAVDHGSICCVKPEPVENVVGVTVPFSMQFPLPPLHEAGVSCFRGPLGGYPPDWQPGLRSSCCKPSPVPQPATGARCQDGWAPRPQFCAHCHSFPPQPIPVPPCSPPQRPRGMTLATSGGMGHASDAGRHTGALQHPGHPTPPPCSIHHFGVDGPGAVWNQVPEVGYQYRAMNPADHMHAMISHPQGFPPCESCREAGVQQSFGHENRLQGVVGCGPGGHAVRRLPCEHGRVDSWDHCSTSRSQARCPHCAAHPPQGPHVVPDVFWVGKSHGMLHGRSHHPLHRPRGFGP